MDCGSLQSIGCVPPRAGAKEVDEPTCTGQPALGCEGEMLASTILLSPFIFVTDLAAADVFHPCPQPVPTATQCRAHSSHCTASQLYVSITHCK